MELIDSHVHFWPATRLQYNWLETEPKIAAPHGPREYQLESAAAREAGLQLRGLVFVEAGRAPAQGLAEAKWVASLAQEAPILGIVAHASLELGVAIRPSLALLAKMRGDKKESPGTKESPDTKGSPVVGIRRNYQEEAPGFALQLSFARGLRALADFGFTHDLCIRWHQIEETIELVARCPEVQFILDHCAKPAITTPRPPDADARWRAGMRALAAQPNVVCKLSGLVTEADHARWQPADLWPYLDHALEVFGTERLLFGSDWPVVKLASRWARWLATLREALVGLSEAEQSAIFAGNARRVYGLSVDE